MNKWMVIGVFLVACNSGSGQSRLLAQGTLRASLERLDVDKDGEIEPEEITPLARPYLERIAKARRMSLDRDNRVEDFQEAARIYHALENGVSGKSVRYEGEKSIKRFGPSREDALVPEFGLAEVKYPYTEDDVREADRTLRRYDRDEDGYIDRTEARYAKWTHIPPFASDLNNDDRLSRMELGQRYARRRLLQSDSGELVQKSRRVGNGIRRNESEKRRDDSQWWRKGGNSYWLTASILGRFDANRNGSLDQEEALELGIPFGQLDADRDGMATRDEMQSYMAIKQDEAGVVAEGLPGWFYELDADSDGQVAMAEFTSEWTDAKLREFTSLDANDDGLLTSIEVAQSKAMMGGSYSNQTAQVIPPRQTIISEIEVTDEFVIGDLNLQLSITHTNVSFLDAHLTGPEGQRIELFTEIGGSGDHFEETIFDDQSRNPISKARPPFKGSFQPESLLKRQPSLGTFSGTQAQGVWQLVIRATRSERFGMLHNWNLIFRPIDDMLDAESLAATEPASKPSTANSPREPQSNESGAEGRTAAVSTQKEKWKQASWEDKDPIAVAEKKRSQLERYRQWVASQGDKEIPEGKRKWAEKAQQELESAGSGDSNFSKERGIKMSLEDRRLKKAGKERGEKKIKDGGKKSFTEKFK